MQIVALPAAMLGLVAAVAILMALDKLFRKEQETLQLQR